MNRCTTYAGDSFIVLKTGVENFWISSKQNNDALLCHRFSWTTLLRIWIQSFFFSLMQHLTKQQLYGHLPPISKTIPMRWTRDEGKLLKKQKRTHVTFSDGRLHMGGPVLTDRQELIYNNSAWTQDAVLKTCQERWIIGTNGERHRVWEICVSSVTWYIYIYTYIYIYIIKWEEAQRWALWFAAILDSLKRSIFARLK